MTPNKYERARELSSSLEDAKFGGGWIATGILFAIGAVVIGYPFLWIPAIGLIIAGAVFIVEPMVSGRS